MSFADIITRLQQRIEQVRATVPTFEWAEVATVAPPTVLLDSDATATPRPIADVQVSGLTIGDRVEVRAIGSRRDIVGPTSAGRMFAIGEHRAGEWSEATKPAGTVLPDGSVLNIVDYPLLAAHYEAVYGFANHHGGDGVTTFGVPDTRERVYANRGGFDIFATIGVTAGAKTHVNPLTEDGYARINGNKANDWIAMREVSAPTWQASGRTSGDDLLIDSSTQNSSGVGLGGNTGAASSVQPTFVCQFVIQAV
jgi:microcystin-dependent protein